MKVMQVIALLATIYVALGELLPIDNYGATVDTDTDAAAEKNGLALANALTGAKAGDVVVVPAGKTYYFFPNRTHAGLKDVTLQIDGVIKARTNYASWPTYQKNVGGKTKYLNIFEFINCTGLTLQGSGTVDGQGSDWWWAFALGKLKTKRPLMLICTNCIDLEIKGLHFLNSPRFNLLINGHGIKIHDISVIADWQLQRSIHMHWKQSLLDAGHDLDKAQSLMFPFNTDGIDPSGTNIHIYNCSISNYDDIIAVKPGGIDDPNEGCTQNVLVEDLTVYKGAGLSIGSVHPATTRNCVRNVVFRNIVMYSPLKGVYVKPDLGTEGTAIIENVTFENIIMHQGEKPPNWPPAFTLTQIEDPQQTYNWTCMKLDYTCMEWPIYLGPQQQLEPDGSGSGIWPATEPKVSVNGLTLRKVHSHGGVWPNCAGVLRCNSANPCTGVTLDDVVIKGKFLKCAFGNKFICDDNRSIVGEMTGVTPATECIRISAAREIVV